MSEDRCTCPHPTTCEYCSRMYPCRCEHCPHRTADLTDDEIEGIHRIAKEVGDAQVMTLCEIALGEIGITRSIARDALRGAKR